MTTPLDQTPALAPAPTAAPESLPVAVRAHAVRCRPPVGAGRGLVAGLAGRPAAVLVFDTETTTDATQALLFGAWQYYRVHPDGGLTLAQEGLFYADDLPDRDPAGFAVLLAYASTHTSQASAPFEGRSKGRPSRARRPRRRPLELLSRSQWVERVLYRGAYQGRARITAVSRSVI